MFIHEAIKECCNDQGVALKCITRKSWIYVLAKPCKCAVKIRPTNTPFGCIVIGEAQGIEIVGWQPTLEDLSADDWEIAY